MQRTWENAVQVPSSYCVNTGRNFQHDPSLAVRRCGKNGTQTSDARQFVTVRWTARYRAIPLDERQKRSEFRFGAWRTLIRVGLDILGNLVDGTKVKVEMFAGVAFGHASVKETANLGSKFHILQHGLRRGKGREQFQENFPEIVPESPLLGEDRKSVV